MTRARLAAVSLCLALALCCPTPSRAQAGLGAALDRILNAPALKGGVTGAMVCRAADGKVLYAHNADVRLIPASNRKLWTSAAALELLGDDYVLHTDLCAPAKPDAAGMVQGSLFLRGGGDGLLSPADLDVLAAALAASGVKEVTGDVVGDGTLFTDGPYGFGWEWDDLSDEEFPQISALEVNEGVLAVHVAPGTDVGDAPTVTLDPPTAFQSLDVQARTGAKDAPDTCKVSRPYGEGTFVVTGTLPLGKRLDAKVPVNSPPLLAATLLREALARHGITVDGKPMIGKTPPDALTLTSHASLRLSQYLAKMNKPSDNLLAESLIRLVGAVKGHGGSYDAGHAVETSFFRSLGVDTTPLALVDGCGVGRRNYVTARAVSQLLLGMHREKDWRVYYASLPIAGVDGTLKSRLKGTRAENNVHAKTGTLGGVRALSGYFTGRSGKLYVFSLLMNNFPGTARQAGGVQDDFLKRVLGVL